MIRGWTTRVECKERTLCKDFSRLLKKINPAIRTIDEFELPEYVTAWKVSRIYPKPNISRTADVSQ